MRNGRHLARFQASRFTTWGARCHEQSRVREFRYRHVLVSTRLNRADHGALLLGFELASLHQSALTLLHVRPRPLPERPTRGLDAIGLLHAAVEQFRGSSAGQTASEAGPHVLRQFVAGIVPPGLLEAVDWRGEWRGGDASGTVASYVNESAADLVILPAEPFRWWPLASPFSPQMIERRTPAHVIVVRDRAASLLP